MAPLASLLLLLATASGPVSGADPETLLFSFITSFGGFGFDAAGVVPAVDLALEEINTLDVLPGYKLRYNSVLDSEVREAVIASELGGAHSKRLITVQICLYVHLRLYTHVALAIQQW